MKDSGEFNKSVDRMYWLIAVRDDENAFRSLFQHFFAPLCGFAYRYIPDLNVCEDIVQDVFLKLWENRKSQEISTSLRNFLVTNVKNSCIDFLRKNEIRQKYEFNQQEQIHYTKAPSEDIYTIRELEQMIEAALNKLPQNVKEVFELSRFKGLTYQEIAKSKEISVKTVEAYMTRALKLLRIELKDYLPFIYLFLWLSK